MSADGGEDHTLSLSEAWHQTAGVLGDRLHARWMLEVVCGLDSDEWNAAQRDLLTQGMVARLDRMIARYQDGEPLQYVLGRWGFRHLDLMVDQRVLIPRPETELVAKLAIEKARGFSPRRVLDLGTGSGAIGLAMADELPIEHTEIWMTDLSEEALDVARANLAGMGRAGGNVRLARGDWYSALNGVDAPAAFDVIVSNPPYVVSGEADASVEDWEPGIALYADRGGLAAYDTIIDGAATYLARGGWLVLEIGASQAHAVRQRLLDSSFREITVHHDLAGHDRAVLAQRR